MVLHQQEIFFSIIIPTFNASSTIRECLESVFSQSFPFFEILIIDGHSSDNTVEIIGEFKEKYPQIKMVSEKDKGIYDAMNKGIRMAEGEWVLFLGADDRLHNNHVLKEVKDCNLSIHKVIYGSAKIIGDTSWSFDGDIYDGQFDLKKLLIKNICHQAIFYNLAYIKEKIGIFNIDYDICSDWDFNLRCWANKPMHYVDIIIADFYGGGATTKKNKDDIFGKDFKKNVTTYFTVNTLKKQLEPKDLVKFGVENSRTKLSILKKWLLKRWLLIL